MKKQKIVIGMMPSHPGLFVKEEVQEPLRLTVTRMADVLGVRRATLSDFLNGKAGLSPEMALRLEKAFGVNMDTLLKMQAWFDACVMRQKSSKIRVRRYMAKAFENVSASA